MYGRRPEEVADFSDTTANVRTKDMLSGRYDLKPGGTTEDFSPQEKRDFRSI